MNSIDQKLLPTYRHKIYLKIFLSIKVDVTKENDASISSLKKKKLDTCKRSYK